MEDPVVLCHTSNGRITSAEGHVQSICTVTIHVSFAFRLCIIRFSVSVIFLMSSLLRHLAVQKSEWSVVCLFMCH
jgi:hypothetical protein